MGGEPFQCCWNWIVDQQCTRRSSHGLNKCNTQQRQCTKQKLKWATSANENLNEQQDIDKVEQRIDDTLKHLQKHAQDKIKRYVAPEWREAS